MPFSPVARRRAAAVAGLAVFLLALAVLRRELSQASLGLVKATLAQVTYSRIAIAMVLTALNYAVLAYSDILAIKSIGRRLQFRMVAAASFIAYAISNNVGFALVSGVSVRSRFYTRWGLSWEEISRVVIAYSTTFWVGLLALGGAVLALMPWPSGPPLLAQAAQPLGWVLFATSFTVIVLALGRRTIRIRSFEWAPPSASIAFRQWLVSLLDWTLAAGVVWALLPPDRVPLGLGISAFVVSQLAGLASHVPGGLGVFEGSMVVLLKPYVSSSELAGTLVLY
ncbi:MAG TPA: lysylphosphatidylglycerol synthase domain-containing protein, partial [Vicinamibacterales bacterium]